MNKTVDKKRIRADASEIKQCPAGVARCRLEEFRDLPPGMRVTVSGEVT